jgi:hypothetical protein
VGGIADRPSEYSAPQYELERAGYTHDRVLFDGTSDEREHDMIVSRCGNGFGKVPGEL